jgi:DnaK suppressor protein
MLPDEKNILEQRLKEQKNHLTSHLEFSAPSFSHTNEFQQREGQLNPQDGSKHFYEHPGVLDFDRLERINSALQRLNQGNYGICDFCQEKISFVELKALPYRTRCNHCSRH